MGKGGGDPLPSLGPPSCVIDRVSEKCQALREHSVTSSGHCLRRDMQPQSPTVWGQGFREPPPWGAHSQKPKDGQEGKAVGAMTSGPLDTTSQTPCQLWNLLGSCKGSGSFPAYEGRGESV